MIERAQAAVRLLMDDLGLDIKSEFDGRLVLQKVTYLLQETGVNFGYSFNWYKHGPYSPGLTQDAYEAAALPGAPEGLRLSDAARSVLDQLATPPGIERPDWLELLASLRWQGKRLNWNASEVREELRKTKSDLMTRVGTRGWELALSKLSSMRLWHQKAYSG